MPSALASCAVSSDVTACCSCCCCCWEGCFGKRGTCVSGSPATSGPCEEEEEEQGDERGGLGSFEEGVGWDAEVPCSCCCIRVAALAA